MWNWLGGAAPPVVPTDAPVAEDPANRDGVQGSAAAEEGVSGTGEGAPGSGEVTGNSGGAEKAADDLDVGIATENVKQVASKLGSYLYGFASVATNTASKLKDTAAGG